MHGFKDARDAIGTPRAIASFCAERRSLICTTQCPQSGLVWIRLRIRRGCAEGVMRLSTRISKRRKHLDSARREQKESCRSMIRSIGNVMVTDGWGTDQRRNGCRTAKTHASDAYCMRPCTRRRFSRPRCMCTSSNSIAGTIAHSSKLKRRAHTNRTPKTPGHQNSNEDLEEGDRAEGRLFAGMVRKNGGCACRQKAKTMRSRPRILPVHRSRSNTKRIMPGAEFVCERETYVLRALKKTDGIGCQQAKQNGSSGRRSV